MRAFLCLLAASFIVLAPAAAGDSGSYLAPTYSAASVVNSATNLTEALAPNTIATLYGEHLSYNTRAVTADDIRNNRLPTVLAGTGVRVLLNGIPSHVYFVSPKQINFLIPSNLLPGRIRLQVVRDGHSGREVYVWLRDSAPALYQLDQETAIATRPDGSVATSDSPARPGDVVILYGTGLGETDPRSPPGQVALSAVSIRRMSDFRVLLDGSPVPASDVYYAGLTPGFAGLYQINLRLPDDTGDRPEIRIRTGSSLSPPGIRLPVLRQ